MVEITVAHAQADMRRGYLSGAPGIAASGLAWVIAAGIGTVGSASAAVLALLIGGTVIHPIGVVLASVLGRSGSHTKGNPLARLAAEGTFWMLAGIAIAYGMHALRAE